MRFFVNVRQYKSKDNFCKWAVPGVFSKTSEKIIATKKAEKRWATLRLIFSNPLVFALKQDFEHFKEE